MFRSMAGCASEVLDESPAQRTAGLSVEDPHGPVMGVLRGLSESLTVYDYTISRRRGVGVNDGCMQPGLDESQDRTVRHPHPQALEQLIMWNRVERHPILTS